MYTILLSIEYCLLMSKRAIVMFVLTVKSEEFVI